jgi:uncharacterized repeat protein (TIGR03803 family)
MQRILVILALALGVVLSAQSNAHAASFKVIHTFNGPTDGVVPEGSLIFDGAGNLYGTTVGGGFYGGGTVFELSPQADGSWAEKILYNFKGKSDGGAPVAALVMDAQGNLYGTAQQQGIMDWQCSIGCGVVFELSPGETDWTYTVLYSFTGMPDGAFPSGPLSMDAAGNLYGTTGGGGKDAECFEGCGTVFELVKGEGWKEQLLHTFGNEFFDGAYPAGELTFDEKGNLYGSTNTGGTTNGYGTVFELGLNKQGTWTEKILYNFCSQYYCADGNGPAGGVILLNGHLLGTTQGGGGGSGYYGVFFDLSPAQPYWTTQYYDFDISDGAAPQSPLIYRQGRTYGVTTQGGIQNNACALYPQGNGVVFEMSQQDGSFQEQVLYEFTGGSDGCGPIGGLVADNAGHLYGTTSQGAGNENGGTVFEVTP